MKIKRPKPLEKLADVLFLKYGGKSDALKFYEQAKGLIKDKLKIARNEIFARHGHVFEDIMLKKYFINKKWYKPIKKISFKELNIYEKYNVMLIKYFELLYNLPYWDESDIKNKEKYYLFPSNKVVEYDLNSDNVKEKIKYIPSGEGYKIYINDKFVENNYLTNNYNNFVIADIDKKDKFKEIIICDAGPSDDYSSVFYHFDSNRIIEIGKTEGAYDWGLYFFENGYIEVLSRAQILQTWFITRKYQLVNHTLKEVPKDIFYTKHYVFLKKNLILHKDRTEKSSCFRLNEGQILKISATDNKKWCLIETETGKKGWLLVNNFNYFPDMKAEASDIFIGLSHAD